MAKAGQEKYWLIVALGLIIIAAISLSKTAPALFQPNEKRFGYDPLSQVEQDRAVEIALNDFRLKARLKRISHKELLLVERHQEDKTAYKKGQWPRRADVFWYDYDANGLIQTVVNLETEKVEQISSARQVQLPLNEAETARAIELAFADPLLSQSLKDEYFRLTGKTLTDPAQVNIKPFTFYASAIPEANLDKAVSCGLHRCAQILIYTRDNFAFEMQPVIDLSAGIVASQNTIVEAK